jgi:ankyrin repeat protein
MIKKIVLAVLVMAFFFSAIFVMDRRGGVFRRAAQQTLRSPVEREPAAAAEPRERRREPVDTAAIAFRLLEEDEALAKSVADDGGASAVAPEAEDCAICLNPLSSEIGTLLCGHTFHSKCIQQMVDSGVRKVCPLCRASFDPREKLKELFDAVRRGSASDVRRIIDTIKNKGDLRFRILSVKNRADHTPLSLAVEMRNESIVRTILDSVDGWEQQQNLLRQQSRLSTLAGSHYSSLQLAVHKGLVGILSYFIELAPNQNELRSILIHPTRERGQGGLLHSALYTESRESKVPMVEQIIGAVPIDDVRTRMDLVRRVNGSRRTPLHLASIQGIPRITEILLSVFPAEAIEEKMKLLFQTDRKEHNTALHIAAQYGYENIARFLVESLLDPIAQAKLVVLPNDYGRTALALAALSDNRNTFNLLKYLCIKIPDSEEKIQLLSAARGIVSLERSYAKSTQNFLEQEIKRLKKRLKRSDAARAAE